MRRLVITVLCCIGCASLLSAQLLLAHGEAPAVYVHNTSATPVQASADGVPALKIRALFSLLDSAGLPSTTEIDRVELRVGQDRYTATFSKPSGDWAIAVLIDTSGTLAGSAGAGDYRRMIEGLAKSLDSMPENALYTVVTFDNTTNLIEEFTRDKEEVRKKLLTTVNAKAGAKACLNDGLLEAARRVGQATTRSAVIAVTASQDACGDTSTQAVVDQAASSGTQIHILGINGYAINLATLEKYTQPTRGLAYMRSPNDLIFGLTSLLSGLGKEWEANWTIYPPKGEQTVPIAVTLKDTSVLNGQITFTSDKAYVPPPKIDLVGEVRSTVDSVLVNLSIVNRARIAVLRARIIDKLTGQPRLDQLLPKVQESLALPANALEKDGSYSLEIAALDNQNNVLAQIQPRDFQYKPSPLLIAIMAVSAPSIQSPNFIVTVTTSTGDVAGIARYKAWLETEQSNGPLPNTEVFQSPDAPLLIPAGDLPGGTYQVKAQALNGANQVIADVAKPFPVNYAAPGLIDRLLFGIGQSAVAVVGLLLLAILAVVALYFMVRFARSRSRVPVSVVEPALPDRVHYAAPLDDRSRVVIPSDASQVVSPPPASATLATLTAREPATLHFQANIAGQKFSLGRSSGNDAKLPVDGQSGVSGHHAVITFERGAWYIKDNNSTNGTFVNGQRLPPGGHARLADRVVIGLGPKVKLEFRITS